MASQQPGQQQPPRKTGMRSPVTWIILLGVALAGGAYLLYRRSQSAAAAGTSTSTATVPAGTANPDWSGEISTLQTEIMDLQSSQAQDQNEDQDQDDGKVAVPDVVGEDAQLATQALTARGLKAAGVTPFPKNTPKGSVRLVTAQAPKGGTSVSRGTTVTLTTKVQTPEANARNTVKTAAAGSTARKPPARKPAKAPAHHTTRKKAA